MIFSQEHCKQNAAQFVICIFQSCQLHIAINWLGDKVITIVIFYISSVLQSFIVAGYRKGISVNEILEELAFFFFLHLFTTQVV